MSFGMNEKGKQAYIYGIGEVVYFLILALEFVWIYVIIKGLGPFAIRWWTLDQLFNFSSYLFC